MVADKTECRPADPTGRVAAQVLALVDQAIDHQQGNHQQQNQQGDGAQLEAQGTAHGTALRSE